MASISQLGYIGIGASNVKAWQDLATHVLGMEVIPGQCPFMFLPGAQGVHRLHGFFRRITGRYPQHRRAA